MRLQVARELQNGSLLEQKVDPSEVAFLTHAPPTARCSFFVVQWRRSPNEGLQGSIFLTSTNGGSTISALVLTSWCSTLMHPMILMSGHLRLMPVCFAWRIPWTLIFDFDMTSFIDLGELSLQPWSPTQQKRAERNSTYVLEIVIPNFFLFNLIWSETWS